MEEAEQLKTMTGTTASTNAGVKDRMAEATSSETLSDVEETESVSTTEPSETSADERSSVPAPDGTPDMLRSGLADGSDNAEPM